MRRGVTALEAIPHDLLICYKIKFPLRNNFCGLVPTCGSPRSKLTLVGFHQCAWGRGLGWVSPRQDILLPFTFRVRDNVKVSVALLEAP